MRRGQKVLFLVAVVALAGAIVWWLRHRSSDSPATHALPQPTGSATRTVQPASAVEHARLVVAVTDDKGPLGGAIVRLAPKDGDIVVMQTGPDGTAAVGIDPGTWAISASAPDHVPQALTKELAANADVHVAFKLPLGGRVLSGTVTDASGGPIEGARIDAAKLGALIQPSDAVASTLTKVDGTYTLGVAEGQLLVAASSPDYTPQSRYVEVGAAGATANFALVPGGVIEGVVRDERTKQPVGGALVTAQRDTRAVLLAEAARRHVVARPDGRFRLAGLAPGAWELAASDASRHTKAATLVGIGVAEQVSDVELLVGTGPVLRGKVVDDAGTPVANAEVTANTEGDADEAKSDASGAFAFAGLRPGRYVLMAHADGVVPAGATQTELADKDVDVVVRVRHGAKVKGHVEPRQVCDIRYELDDSELGPAMPMLLAPTTSDTNGEFELGPASPGKGKLFARCTSGDQGSRAIEIKAGMPEVVIEVKPGASIAGRVLDGDGKPVAAVTVMAEQETTSERTVIVNGMVTSGVQALTTAAGTYELRALAPGTYHLRVLDRGKPLRGKPVKVELATNEKKTGIDLAVDRPTGVIKGTVTGPDGTPLADAWVSVHQGLDSLIDGMHAGPGESSSHMVMVEGNDDNGGAAAEFPPALTDAHGHYEIRGLPHARYDVVAEAQKGQLRARRSDVTPDATVDLQALGVTTLSGTVRGGAGPAKLFSVELEGPTHAQRSFTDGAFSFGRVDPGQYTIRVTSSDGNAEQKLEVVPNQPATIDIVLAANAIVVGKLVDGGGKPLGGVPVVLVPDAGDGRVQVQLEGPPPTSNADGTFHLEHRAERSTLVVMVPPHPITKQGLALEPGKTLDVGAVVVAANPPKSP